MMNTHLPLHQLKKKLKPSMSFYDKFQKAKDNIVKGYTSIITEDSNAKVEVCDGYNFGLAEQNERAELLTDFCQ